MNPYLPTVYLVAGLVCIGMAAFIALALLVTKEFGDWSKTCFPEPFPFTPPESEEQERRRLHAIVTRERQVFDAVKGRR